MKHSAIILLLLFTLLVISPFMVLADATLVVNTIADEDDVVANSTCSLREAITSANTNANYGGCVKTGTYGADTITFSTSVFSSSQIITLTSDLPNITSPITITGPGSSLLTISSGDIFRPFFISTTASVTISGVTILDVGSPAGAGGAINVSSGTVTVNNVAFSSNLASLTGGAIHVASGATVKVNTSSFLNNSSTLGGAIYSEGTLRVSNSSFTNNFAFDYGGAITNTGANSVIGGSTFYNNNTNGSGGAYVGNGTIFNSTFLDNTAANFGGAIANINAGTLKLIHVTAASNTATGNGGDGVYVQIATINIMNSILADNDESDCLVGMGGGTVSANYSLISDGSCGITNGVNGNLVSEAFFSPYALQTNGGPTMTLALSPASPGVNAGSNSYRMEGNAAVNTDFNGDGDKTDTLSTDQRGTGFPRTNHSTVDMGAFETSTVFTGLSVDTVSDTPLYSCTAAADDCSLRGAIMLANARSGADTISFASSVFSSPQTITLGTGLPVVTTNITINGPGLTTTISGNDAYLPFVIDNGTTLTINGLTIIDGYEGSGNGGAFYITNGSLNLSNSSIESSSSSGNGGAIYLQNGSLTVSSSNFSNNTSSGNGGAIYLQNGSLTVSSSSFSNNISNDSGGAIYSSSSGNVRVNNSTLSNNSATNSGGAIFSESSIFIGGSTFSSNNASMGGGIFTNGGTIFNSTFANNVSWSQGGAINNDAALSLSLINVTLSNNAANGGMGGASVYTGNAALFIMNSILANSTASGECSTNLGMVSVFNSIVEDASCGVVTGVSGNIAADAFLDVNGLQNNGGATQTIAIAPSSPAINAGSNLALSEDNMDIDFNLDGDFLDTLGTDQRGTGFTRILQSTVDMGAFEMSNSTFTGLVVDTTSDTELFNCTNAANDCSLRSAIRLANARSGADVITFSSSVFSTSQTILSNGEFANIRSDITITGPGSNLLTIDGNGYRPFYIENNALVSISGIRVRHAASGLQNGAAIYLNSGSLSLDNMIFNNNEAPQGSGGAIYANTGSLDIADSTFFENAASTGDGGAIAVNTASLSITNSNFSQNNSANSHGGAIYNASGTMNIADSTFSNNSAVLDGGAIYNNSGSVRVRGSSFDQNSANSSGGAIYTISDIEVLDSLFEDNTAANSAGAIFSESIHPNYTTIAGSSFSGNEANNGGALAGWLRIVNSSFAFNTATNQGGAIYSSEESVYLSYVSMGFNSAATGGAVYSDDGYIELLNTIVADSTNGGDCAMGPGGTFFSIASIVEDDSCDFDETQNGNLVADPMFDSRGLQDNSGSVPSLAISPLSPAIDAGNPGSGNAFLFESGFGVDVNGDGDTNDTIDFDQRGTGFPRVATQVDMGAIEQTASISLMVDSTSDSNLRICTSAPGDCSLRGAINITNTVIGPDTIGFDSNVFNTTLTIMLTSDLPSITDDLSITGSSFARINGGDAYRPFYIDNGAIVSLSYLTIRDAADAGDGGAIHLADGNLTLDNITVTSSESQSAAAVLFITTGSSATISNSSFGSNASSGHGGVIYNQGNLYVSNSSFLSNNSGNDGGAIYNENLTEAVVIAGSTFQGNSATDGGAIYGRASIVNSSFYGNNASNLGGAIFLNEASHLLTLVNVTINDNDASVNGGGIYVAEGTITLRNTIVSNSQNGDCLIALGTPTITNSLIEDGGCGITNAVDGNLTGDPLIEASISNHGGLTDTLALPPASPAKDAGSNTYLSEATVNIDFNNDNDTDDVLEFDQRGTGFDRIVNSTVDMGAYETSGTFAGLVVDTTNEGTDTFCTTAPNDCSLNGAIYLANGIAGANTITFDATVFNVARTISPEEDFYSITGDLTITGTGVNLLTIDAEEGRPFSIDNGASVSISGMSVNDASYSGSGGAIYIIDASGSAATINNMSFDTNLAISGGAIYAGYGTTLTVSNSTFTNNTASIIDGGAINGATGSSITITNSSFSDNSSANNGGAVFSDSAVHIIGSSFSGNSAVNGGAVYANMNANIRIVNSSLYMNTASANGGAVNVDGISSLLHVTLSANTASSGAGILADGTVTIMNSIIANSTGGDCVYNSGGLTIDYSLIEDGGCGITNGVNGNLTGEPYLAPFTNYGGSTPVLALLPFSPAINAGNNAYLSEATVNIDFNLDGNTDDTLTTDQRGTGFNRLINPTVTPIVDMGAFEANPSTSVSNIAPIRNYYATNTPTLTWGRVSWATGYELQISSSTSFGTLLCGGTAILSVSDLSFTTCELPAGTYYWRVRAMSSTGAGAWSAVDIFVVGGGE